MVTWGEAYLGVIGPFAVSIPWWSEVEPVVAHLHQVLDVPVLVLRLLLVEGGKAAATVTLPTTWPRSTARRPVCWPNGRLIRPR